MHRTLMTLIGMAIVAAALSSCSQDETGTPRTEPEPAVVETAADPTIVDADHYAVEFENDRVRVLRITYGPGEESVMHDHPDGVAVYLTDHHVRFGMPDGSSQEVHGEAGGHDFAPGGPHLPRNIGDEPLELVLVELKSAPRTGAPPAAETGPDPTVVDADHYTTAFENDRVRVLRIAYGPGEKSVMHHHPDSVAVFLTDHHVRFATPDGSSEEVHKAAGQHIFVPAGQHLPENIGDEPWELYLVELRGP